MIKQIKVPADAFGTRVDVFLASALPAYSRSFWQKQLSAQKVLWNKQPAKASFELTAGIITVNLPENIKHDIKLPIIYQDDDVVVINKPAGILTHAKGMLADEATVADFVRPLTTDGVDTNRPGIVHRLDRNTSGILIAARHETAKHWLQKQFSARKVKKTYLALVEGGVKPKQAVIDVPIGRNPKKPQTFRADPNGKPAKTHYQVVKKFTNHSLLRLTPTTGRTHQLRVHLAHIGHPIVGDALYGQQNTKRSRTFLHAAELEISLPSKARRTFSAPLPPGLEKFLKTLR